MHKFLLSKSHSVTAIKVGVNDLRVKSELQIVLSLQRRRQFSKHATKWFYAQVILSLYTMKLYQHDYGHTCWSTEDGRVHGIHLKITNIVIKIKGATFWVNFLANNFYTTDILEDLVV